MRYQRIFVIVIDSLGIGEMPDAARFGDVGTDTLGHIAERMLAQKGSFEIPNLVKLGMANLKPMAGITPAAQPMGRYMTMRERSNGKDTMTGHWEMMGIETKEPFITFTDTGFPKELIDELEKATGRHIIGNKAASGTAILDELAEREIENGELIVYTSADSVMQICGNEETMGLETLYRYCEIARELTMQPQWRVGRVIARPYVGRKKGEFVRTANRHDYAVPPTGPTVLDALKTAGYDVISIGKINDIFSGVGITENNHSESSVHGMEQTIDIAKGQASLAMNDEGTAPRTGSFTGVCFVNLVDFDAKWGHRRNPIGYGEELERFDEKLGQLLPILTDQDLLIITADHGNDPTYTGTDHTREKVPFLAWSPSMTGSGMLPETDTFAAIGATIADNFGIDMPAGTIGTSVLEQL
ncbi:MAG: phosphopentomutase [Lachnospiraceae bacterium]|nr:phosphopentomutase [Lachnospiraceae bacterium]